MNHHLHIPHQIPVLPHQLVLYLLEIEPHQLQEPDQLMTGTHRLHTPVYVLDPVQEVAQDPVQQVVPDPVQQVTLDPVQQLVPDPVQQVALDPVQQVAPDLVHQIALDPVQQVAAEETIDTVYL